ncbi:hypothetical protein PVK06_020275 [Gossypium arboreum]|uniref:Retrovirus-related Pol polyprotein from transposon TNT 1-94-like beta-barrel domain-containing protein n=1 Tax=Gossypium arboreum TaxID=29729 RepID=A0ABR0PLX4_GOSAR|nr:hypothetical protein PVK06_020275 [Gossypium arboreum]
MSLDVNKYIPDLSKFKPLVHLIEDLDKVIIAMVFEVNLVENDTKWIVDKCASKHFCANKKMFTEFENVTEGEQVYIVNPRRNEK